MIKQNLTHLKNQISQFEKKYHRLKNSVQLLAASKNQSIEKMIEAYQAGQMIFGENYLQEALEKIAALKYLPLEWHFIGRIQSNKTKKIAEHFDWVESIVDIHIAKRLNDQRPIHLKPLNICIEVNINQEESKSGVDANHVRELALNCLQLPRLKLRGLMCIPTIQISFDEQRANFRKLFSLYQSLNASGIPLDTLSMGMSGDYEAAIAEGATLIRIGTALFGPR